VTLVQSLQQKERELLETRQQLTELLARKERDEAAIKAKMAELDRQEKIGHLLRCVEPEAMKKLMASEEFAKEFDKKDCFAFVMSVDIRKSTDLMLKATEPRQFAAFIKNLCNRLAETVKEHHGVFDKFTGDGILAFFPDFFSGEDAGLLVLQAAEACHQAFHEEYYNHRHCFSSVYADAGLGIGIDCGNVALVSDWGGLTVVGTPVVYACRLGSAPAGMTLLNQQAYSQIFERYSAYCSFEETTVHIKNDDAFIGYRVRLNGKPSEPKEPEWLTESPQPARESADGAQAEKQ
jgi:class 3 adenylate cyclase